MCGHSGHKKQKQDVALIIRMGITLVIVRAAVLVQQHRLVARRCLGLELVHCIHGLVEELLEYVQALQVAHNDPFDTRRLVEISGKQTLPSMTVQQNDGQHIAINVQVLRQTAWHAALGGSQKITLVTVRTHGMGMQFAEGGILGSTQNTQSAVWSHGNADKSIRNVRALHGQMDGYIVLHGAGRVEQEQEELPIPSVQIPPALGGHRDAMAHHQAAEQRAAMATELVEALQQLAVLRGQQAVRVAQELCARAGRL